MKPDISSACQLRLKLGRATVLLVCLMLFLSPALTLRAAEAAPPKRVLLLHDYGQEAAGRAILDRSFEATLRSSPPGSVEFFSDTLELYRFPGESHALLMRDYLRRKYAGIKLDVIVVVFDATLEFILRSRDELFPDVPIVYLVLKRPAPGAQPPATTGLWEGPRVRDTLEMALRLHPDTEQVFVVSGRLNNDIPDEHETIKQLKEFEGRVAVHHLTDLPLDELTARVKNLPARSIVLCPRQNIGVGGRSIPPFEAAALIAQASNVPVYGIVETWVGRGIVGGKVVSLEQTGAELARRALSVANGARLEEIPVAEAPTVMMFDWRQLHRFSIGQDRLPPGSVVRFEEPTFWGQYRWYIVGVLSLCAVEALLIAVLLYERKRRQRAKAALDRLNAELEGRVAERTSALTAKTREMESFACTVAHDLKAPLRGIDGYGRLLLDDYMDVLDEKGRILLRTIRSSSARMSRLIEDLLDYSRVEQRAFAPGRVELWPLVAALVAEKRDEIEARGIELSLNVNGASVTGDAEGLKQALGNYLDNAIKFTRDAAHPSIEVGADETDGCCRLWVRDNGVGFDMKHRERVFEIFHRLRPAGDYPGTGVGLAIARKAAERMGGRAWAESEPGRGSTFYLEVPKEGRAPRTASQVLSNTSPY